MTTPTAPPTAPPTRTRLTAPAVAAVGLYVAAGGHLGAALQHLEHGARYAVFFVAVALLQVLVGGRLGRARPAGVAAALAGTLALVLLYVASRTLTLPFGGLHSAFNDRPQDADLLGTVVVLGELLTLATAPALLPAAGRRAATTAMMLLGGGLWAAWAAGLL
jgi:hypothetical protein